MCPNYTFEFLTSPCFQLRHYSHYSTVTTDCDLKTLVFGGQNLAGDKSHRNCLKQLRFFKNVPFQFSGAKLNPI